MYRVFVFLFFSCLCFGLELTITDNTVGIYRFEKQTKTIKPIKAHVQKYSQDLINFANNILQTSAVQNAQKNKTAFKNAVKTRAQTMLKRQDIKTAQKLLKTMQGIKIHEKDIIFTNKNSFARLELNGSTIDLASFTRVKIFKSTNNSLDLELISGKIKISATPKAKITLRTRTSFFEFSNLELIAQIQHTTDKITSLNSSLKISPNFTLKAGYYTQIGFDKLPKKAQKTEQVNFDRPSINDTISNWSLI